MVDFAVGNRGALRITDDGRVVAFYVLCSDPQTYVGAYTWGGNVNGVNVGGAVTLNPGFGSQILAAWNITSSQTVAISQGDTGTWGLGGAAGPFFAYIARAVPPAAPSNFRVDQITGTSFRHQFSGNSDGGSPITQWEVQLATNSSFSPVMRTGIKAPNDGTVIHTNLANGTRYWSRVRGYNGAGIGAWGAIASIETLDVPGTPVDGRTDQVAATSFRYAFSGNGDGGSSVTRWDVQVSTNSSFTAIVSTETLTPSTRAVTIDGLANHDQYWVRSRGINAVGASAWGAVATASTLGHPTAPRNIDATPSTSVTGRINLTWQAPATPGAGGIIGYNIFRNGNQIATTTGTGTSYAVTGLTEYTQYMFTVAARNNYSKSVSGRGPLSSPVLATAPGPPSAPRNLTGSASPSQAGQVTLSWLPPTTTGAGGITGYTIRLADNTFIANVSGSTLTYTKSGLSAGVAYTFKVAARNALADAEGTTSDWSNQVRISTTGEPDAPTGLTVVQSSFVSNRLVLSWNAPTGITLSGYNIFHQIDGVGEYRLIARISANHTIFTVDGLDAGVAQRFHVRARTAYTDGLDAGYPGNWGGPATSNIGNRAVVDNTQTVPNLATAASSQTNAHFNGTYTLNEVTASTLGFALEGGNVASSVAVGTINNLTNATFSGTYTISTPTPDTISYAQTGGNVGPLTTSGGLVVDTTNQSLNGTVTITEVNSGANLLSYASTGTSFAARAVPLNNPPGASGLITNLSNTIFNGIGLAISSVPTSTTFTYTKTGANVGASNAAGTVTNRTNRDVFNGIYTVGSIPAFNMVRISKTNANITARAVLSPFGKLSRTLSPANLAVRFRSGWSG